MKAEKLIINWEKQDLSQVFSVNWQTGDVIVSSTQNIVTITYDTTELCWVTDAETIEDNTILIWDNSQSASNKSIVWNNWIVYDSATTQETILELSSSEVYPNYDLVEAWGNAAWLYRIVWGDQYFFPWEWFGGGVPK